MAATCFNRPVGLTQRTPFLASKPARATPYCRHCLTVARSSTTESHLQVGTWLQCPLVALPMIYLHNHQSVFAC